MILTDDVMRYAHAQFDAWASTNLRGYTPQLSHEWRPWFVARLRKCAVGKTTINEAIENALVGLQHDYPHKMNDGQKPLSLHVVQGDSLAL